MGGGGGGGGCGGGRGGKHTVQIITRGEHRGESVDSYVSLTRSRFRTDVI